ncbi:MAG: histidine ammonia-lyase [Bacteroidetes bacterium GWE2_39_28]|nr:MAG: histidine ammonia-lyase [Bacteroidetes bacterium GWE2_39_28]OFY14664.1 MAG: histidine ammonia-lyase [Bacteroidetes bacterium GWF2_39_10]OFZ07913.1 MAG: histidine ammonia-lyase [Bacteroidetes bacterium RIFOXYB2_FULL_39_7]OFZ12275.1 MAG: histidine ammonia-lyase [Bacteroidetes bacterium RIFOXYC2_FULL_39_11]HCT94280.1 histidine ammonia-lyase [Rikenellaceae bacterium]
MEYFHISSKYNKLDEVKILLNESCKIVITDDAKERIRKSREYLINKIETCTEPIYGITTGFGSLCNVTINNGQLSQLQTNLVMSHACGLGEEVPQEIVRLMLALKIKSLSYGYSGVKPETVQRLADMFNNRVCPVVFKQGSLGASGDLAPLANMSLPLLGMGEVNYNGKRVPASEVNKIFGWEPLVLSPKEGLALLNGTQFMLAYSIWCILKAKKLSKLADLISAVSLDAYLGRMEPFSENVHKVRPHKGQAETAAAIRDILAGSEIVKQKKEHVQDPYSFRCIPQVHGASKDAIEYALNAFETELNSATDNPTILPDDDMIISAGNFHGQPLALPLDFLSIAMSEIGSIAERRTYQLISGKRGLPSFLVAHPGLNSGYMIPQYAQASVASQNKQLCMPACIDTIDSSQGQEDHVSMGANAAVKCFQVVENVEKILAIELMNAAQALDFRRPLKSSPIVEDFVKRFREYVPFVEEDQVMYLHINNAVNFLKQQNY